MARRKMESKLVDQKSIHEELRLVDDSETDYITPSGRIYSDYGNGKFYPKRVFTNKNNGYVYANINGKDGKRIQRRLHRLLAIAYIPNPGNLEYVMHLDNNKENYELTNLKWGTPSENTKQAVDDNLLVNDKGATDSQSIAVNMYDLFSGILIQSFGSISEASKTIGIDKTAIKKSCDEKYLDIKKPYYFRYVEDGNTPRPRYLAMFSMENDEVLGAFINCGHASRVTGIKGSTITSQVATNRKPKRKNKSGVYFLWINNH